MSLCINPVCSQPNHPDNDENRFCQSCGSQLELIGRYRVLRLLSDKTGFGKIYEAYQQDTPKILKVLKEELTNDSKALALFQQEAKVLQQLNHPGIPQTEGYFPYQTRNNLILHCLVMEKIVGPNLEQWLKQQQNRPISEAQAIVWLKQLLEILDLVHNQQYLHRDIKPSNIMIRPDGQLVLIDFGTAREITRTYLANSGGMTAISSSGYSPPEQMRGQAIPSSDFFALGRTFVFLLTGFPPEQLYNPHLDILQWRHHANHVSPLLLEFIDWLISTEVSKRPSNAEEISRRLAAIEHQLTENTSTTVNIGGSGKTEIINKPTTNNTVIPPQRQPEKLPLLSWFAALIVSLLLLWWVSLAFRNTKFAALPPDYGQTPVKQGKVDYFPYEEGKDSQGRVAEFNIAVLSVEYKWQLGSTYQIKYNDQTITLDSLKSNLEQEGIQKIMENPSEIISVGTASCEGNITAEQSRALERSQQIQLLGKKIFSNTPSVKGYRLLNLGQFQRKDCQANQDSTAYQRSIIIIGVKKQSQGVILDEALRDRLEKKPFADFKLEDYSLGSPDKFKTIPSNL
ncbi:serine/threonine-protein kinase [Dolichospermum sp. UHCC 0684]|uniref:serine/threonine-protein kinase n=1 Tax=unclassified Dolichospermum TaxID=2622029 RepID=UPI00144564C9|nr:MULTISPECIES: serine/threonine-protein kinase [unclassified Dolichospermum]MEA5531176.1 serine/threonine-protein kinase [Dolichospermum sp. UHCC 0684]MTJ34464.1 serine/threonine protein kinase [Dolichospermum sp. UHCC 0260]